MLKKYMHDCLHVRGRACVCVCVCAWSCVCVCMHDTACVYACMISQRRQQNTSVTVLQQYEYTKLFRFVFRIII